MLRQQPRAGHQQQGHDREREQEDGAPPRDLEQHAAGERADRRAGRVARHPDADRERALRCVLEHHADERERRRRERRTRQAEHGAGADQHRRAGRESGQHGRSRETRGADQQEAARADPVA
jgi:hypothetical protein